MAQEPSTTTEHTPSHRRWPDVGSLSIRRKVALVLMLPLLLASVLTAIVVNQALGERSRYTDVAQQAGVIVPATRYQSALETAAVLSQNRTPDGAPQLRDAVAQLTQRSAELRKAMSAEGVERAVVTRLTTALSLGEDLRAAKRPGSISTAARIVSLSASEVSAVLRYLGTRLPTPEPRVQGLTLAMHAHLAATNQQLQLASQTGTPADAAQFYADLGSERAALTDLLDIDGGQKRADYLLDGNLNRQRTVANGGAALIDSGPQRIYDSMLRETAANLTASLEDRATAAQGRAIGTALPALLALALAIAAAVAMAHRIVASIRTVRDDTLDVAYRQLPEAVRRIRVGEQPDPVEPVGITTTEETGQLARAVDSLHERAVQLAVDEAEVRRRIADMFTTLSRRTNSLVNQQLSVLDSLEQQEGDEDRLARLFRLDHLASRIRRNAQSLVVLADAPSHATDAQRLSVDDAITAALAGIGDYQRVSVDSAAPEVLQAAVASDVVHILTELIDNAVSFSPPTTTVHVSTEHTSAGVVVTILDMGLGMKPGTLERVRADVASGGEVSVETTRRMGVFVVGRLARRHDLTVAFDANEYGGVSVHLTLPTSLWAPLPALARPPVFAPPPTQDAPRFSRDAPPTTEAFAPVVPTPPQVEQPLVADVETARATPDPVHATAAIPDTDTSHAEVDTSHAEVVQAQSTWPMAVHPETTAPETTPTHESPHTEPVPAPRPGRHGGDPAPAVEGEHAFAQQGVRSLALDDAPTTRSGLPVRTPGAALGPGQRVASGAGTDADGIPGSDGIPRTESGLPMRQPRRAAMPAAGTSTPVTRDPEALRARLSAHAAGVARGRQASAQGADNARDSEAPTPEGA